MPDPFRYVTDSEKYAPVSSATSWCAWTDVKITSSGGPGAMGARTPMVDVGQETAPSGCPTLDPPFPFRPSSDASGIQDATPPVPSPVGGMAPTPPPVDPPPPRVPPVSNDPSRCTRVA